ncbi:hypothetical protein Ahy_A03g013537 isoform B [Arachis hypogaea]|nr:hypothetical protein Ahy_B09g096569 isoform I [Arachis hypogaea]RYR02788.1 hypothetical protein Ahy_B06g081611 isoform B [Arachis hypogaea]RYR09031.1 hypothetical protein Ahy_B05g077005 isoform B [Arachis hypogaea]RYR67233.1 hypothetical protein Ahy_A03g013537 isoform B [Arachis hypogaea]
MGSFSIR